MIIVRHVVCLRRLIEIICHLASDYKHKYIKNIYEL